MPDDRDAFAPAPDPAGQDAERAEGAWWRPAEAERYSGPATPPSYRDPRPGLTGQVPPATHAARPAHQMPAGQGTSLYAGAYAQPGPRPAGPMPPSYGPAQPYYYAGYPAGYSHAPQPKRRSPGEIMAWVIVALLAISLIIVGSLFAAGSINDDGAPPGLPGQNRDRDAPPVEIEESTLEPLVAQCQNGVMASCDLLGAVATPGSEAATIATSCAGHLEDEITYEPGMCSRKFPPAKADSGEDEAHEFPQPDVAALRQDCTDGNMMSCDQLWVVGNLDDEKIAETCGGRREASTDSCTNLTP